LGPVDLVVVLVAREQFISARTTARAAHSEALAV
jgi:hypothetical protein